MTWAPRMQSRRTTTEPVTEALPRAAEVLLDGYEGNGAMTDPQRSAGILPHRVRDGRLEVYLGHMGGPFWSRKDAAAWSVIKGLIEENETALQAALREFAEETGLAMPNVDYSLLGEFRQPSGKRITVFVAQLDDLSTAISGNSFELEWPPHSGRLQSFPEIDGAGWFDLETARHKLVRGQLPIIDALEHLNP